MLVIYNFELFEDKCLVITLGYYLNYLDFGLFEQHIINYKH